MGKETITFRVDSRKKKAIDSLAASLVRDRSFVLNEAIDAYLEVRAWQIAHIEEGVRQADAGKFAKDSEVSAAFARWRK